MRRRLSAAVIGALLLAFPASLLGATPARASSIPSPAPGTTQDFVRSATLGTSSQSMWGPYGATPDSGNLGTKQLFDVSWGGSSSGGSITSLSTPTFDPTPDVCIPDIGCTGDITHADDNTSVSVGDFGAKGSASSTGDANMSVTVNNVGPGNVTVSYPVNVDFNAPADRSFTGGDTITIKTKVTPTGGFIATTPPNASVTLSGGGELSGSVTGDLCVFSCTGNVDIIPSFAVGPANGDIFTANTANHLPIPGPIASASGLSGTLGFPYVQVASTLHPDGSITAGGSDTYDNLTADITKWLFKLAESPVPPHASVPDFGLGISGSYNLVTGQFTITGTQAQAFSFTPQLNISVAFPAAVAWSAGGVSGFGTVATYPAGTDLHVTLPKNQNSAFQMTPSVSMAPSSQFCNKTTNETTTSGNISGLALSLSAPSTSWNVAGFSGTTPTVSLNLGPVFDQTYQLSDSTDTLWNKCWSLGGFSDVTMAAFSIIPDPHIVAAAAPFSPVEGALYSGTVAIFTDPDLTGTADEYTASVVWGDGSTTVSTITSTVAGAFVVSDSHVYAEEGPRTVSVTMTDIDLPSNTSTVVDNITVADAALHATPMTINSPVSYSGPVATFTDDDPAGTVSDYSAQINWGDGTSSTGTVTAGTTGFVVSGAHIYSDLGPHVLTVSINDQGGASATATGSLLTYGFSMGGTFVVGTGAPGNSVNFWGPQWNWNNNNVATNSFKGFANGTTAVAACGEFWTANTGASSYPPSTVPVYMAVLVTGHASGQNKISGTVTHEVVVRVDPGYTGPLGPGGTGTVVAVLC